MDFCSADPKRLVPVAHIVLLDIDETIKEVAASEQTGHSRACSCAQRRPINARSGTEPYDPLWAVLQDDDLSIGFHTAVHEDFLGHQWISAEHTDFMDESFVYFQCVPLVANVQAAFAVLLQGAVFDHFPKLKVNFLEVGCRLDSARAEPVGLKI